MYWLYSILKDCDEPLTLNKINIMSAKQPLDAKYLQKIEKSSKNIKKAFQN